MFSLNMNSPLFAEAGDSLSTEAVNRTVQTFESSWDTVTATFRETGQQIIMFAPKVVAAVVIVVVGYLLAKLIARVTAKVCETIGLQTAAERSGLSESMKQVGIARNVSSTVGLVMFWLVMSVAIMAAFKAAELTVLSEPMQFVVAFIPKILVAMGVVVIGLLVASFLRGVIATSADRVGLSYAEHLANACYYVLAGITLLAAAKHIDLEFELLNQVILIGFGAMAIGFALAFGLGGRDVMGGILAGYYIRQRFAAGDEVRLGEMQGTVREVGPVATTVECEEEGLLHRHSIPNSLMLKEAIR